MAKVVAILSMSLDGYIADVDDGVAEVFETVYLTHGRGGRSLRQSPTV